jgi:NADPH:quinone reductase-like Zn-dependent oxidoreductase
MPRALTLTKIDGAKPGQVYYPIQVNNVSMPKPGPGQVLVRLTTAALNHRDFFIRRHQYPAISFTNPLLADGYGTVVETGPSVNRTNLLNKNVVLLPMRGWDADPNAPEDMSKYCVIGSTTITDAGTAQDYVVVSEDDVEPAPSHLSPAEAAALPLAGLTAWRAFKTKTGCATPGSNILITGIGGGVALLAMQFAIAAGCNVYVTSGDQQKINKAKEMGAKDGLSYKNELWGKDLKKLLPEDRPFIDAVIDGAGGNLLYKTGRFLKPGGVIVQYGMTVGPKMDWPMPAVLTWTDLRGTSMGSRREFKEMLTFVAKNKIRPVVFRTVKGLSNIQAIESLFEEMARGSQFGKLVIEIGSEDDVSKL